MDLFSIIILEIAVFLGFFLQVFVGFAGSLISFPILLLRYDLHKTTAIMSILYVLFSILMFKDWKNIDMKILKKMSLGLILGMFIGVFLLKVGNLIILKRILGAVIVIYIIYKLIKKDKFSIPSRYVYIFGFLGGVLSGLFSAGGPFLIIYLHNEISETKVLRATIIGCLAITNSMRVPLLFTAGLYSVETIVASLIAFPFFILSLYLGYLFFNKVNPVIFKKIFLVVFFLAAISLILG